MPSTTRHLTMATDSTETQYYILSFKHCMMHTVQTVGNWKCSILLSELFGIIFGFFKFLLTLGNDTVDIRLAMGWTVWGSHPSERELSHTHPDRFWGPPSLLHKWYWVCPSCKAARCGVDHHPHLAPRLTRENGYTSTAPLGCCAPFEVNFTLP